MTSCFSDNLGTWNNRGVIHVIEAELTMQKMSTVELRKASPQETMRQRERVRPLKDSHWLLLQRQMFL